MAILNCFKLSVLLLLFFILGTTITAQITEQKYKSVIKGRVVDEAGKPVEDATIRFDVSGELKDKICWVKNTSVGLDKDGRFVHEEFCSEPTRKIFLYIVPPLPDNSLLSIFPPFDALRNRNPKFAGISVLLENSKEVDLGDVQVQVYYNIVELSILNENGKPYYKTEDDWGKFALLIRDETGEFAYGTTLSNSDLRETVNQEKGLIRLALPEGTWTLELLRDLDDYDDEADETKHLLGKTDVTVKKSDSFQSAHLTVKKKNQ